MSPDGTRIAVTVDGPSPDVFIGDLARNTLRRLTFHPASDIRPLWSRDGRSVFYRSDMQGAAVYYQAADGTGAATKLVPVTGDGSPGIFTPEGGQLLFTQVDPTTARDIWAVTLQDGTPRRLVNDPGNQGAPVVSPDGKWLAYSDETGGESAIYVRPFPNVDSGKWQVVPSGAKWPAWSHDGRELFYQTGQAIRAVAIETKNAFTWSSSRLVVEGPYVGFGGSTGPRNFDVAADGRILAVKNNQRLDSQSSEIVVVQHWFEELKRLVPTN